MVPPSTLVPPRRLGALLREARLAAGHALEDFTGACGLPVAELEDIEHGRGTVDEVLLATLCEVYGIRDAGLVPQRSQLVIDLDEGRIALGPDELVEGCAAGPDAILARYLALVYRLRGLPVGAPLHLRDLDVEVLAAALQLAAGDIESRLHRLMSDEIAVRADQQRIKRRVLMPLVGVVIAATGIGTLVLVAREDPPSGEPRIGTAAVVERPSVETDLGNGAAVEENSGR